MVRAGTRGRGPAAAWAARHRVAATGSAPRHRGSFPGLRPDVRERVFRLIRPVGPGEGCTTDLPPAVAVVLPRQELREVQQLPQTLFGKAVDELSQGRFDAHSACPSAAPKWWAL